MTKLDRNAMHDMTVRQLIDLALSLDDDDRWQFWLVSGFIAGRISGLVTLKPIVEELCEAGRGFEYEKERALLETLKTKISKGEF